MLTGHTHKRRTETVDGTTLVVQGSTGGAGLRPLRGDEPTPITLMVLYVDRATGIEQALDDVTLGGIGTSDARITRTVVAEPPTTAPSRS